MNPVLREHDATGGQPEEGFAVFMELSEELREILWIEVIHAGPDIAAADEDEVGCGEYSVGAIHVWRSGSKGYEGDCAGAGLAEGGGKFTEEPRVIVAGCTDVSD
jgi:hypothetical protein